MKHGAKKLLSIFLLLAIVAQPLVVQARAAQPAHPPCPMQMSGAMAQHGKMAHSDCASHAGKACSACDLCSQCTASAVPQIQLSAPTTANALVADAYTNAFLSITLPVDSPPPRNA